MMLPVVAVLLAFLCSLFWSRESLHLENLALRQQLAVYKQMSLGRDCPNLAPSSLLIESEWSRCWTSWAPSSLSATGGMRLELRVYWSGTDWYSWCSKRRESHTDVHQQGVWKMSVTITLDDNLVAQLQVQAEARNLSVEVLALQILSEAMANEDDAAWQSCNQQRITLIRKQFVEG